MESVSYGCGSFVIDAGERRFSNGTTEVPLEPKVFAVIHELLRRPRTLVTRDELLDAVWGHRFVTPSTLNRVVALARRAFGDDADQPRFIQTVHGAGYRFIGSVEVSTAAAREVRARFAPPPAMRLPARLEQLIGREGELEQIAVLLTHHRAVSVLGSGGMGKTVCSLEAARRAAESFPDGVWFVDLAPMQDADEWLEALAAGLLIQATQREDLIEKICASLEGRRALIVLDNCDRIAAATGELAYTLLRGTDEIRILSTSQQPLRFVGEQIMPLPPLQLPDPAWLERSDAAAVEAAPACALLVARARAVQPGFAVTGANRASIADICRRLDGMPLAIELAAARFALLSPDQVLARLMQRFRFLADEVAGRDSRHRNLLALLDWSYNLLSAEEQRFLAWLGVFVQGWTVDAATDVGGSLGQNATLAVDLLNGLVNKSLVTVDRSALPLRYRLLESVREFSLERLRSLGEEQQARWAHLAYVRRLSARIEAETLAGRLHETIDTVIPEDSDITSALEHARDSPAGREQALAIVGSLLLYVKIRGGYDTRWCDLALDGAERLDSSAGARALLCRGVLAVHRSASRDTAESTLLAAAKLAHAAGDRWAEAYASGYRALCLVNVGDLDEAVGCTEITATLAAALDDDLLRGLAGLAQGWIHLARGELRDAVATFEAASTLGPDPHQRHFLEVYTGFAYFELCAWPLAAQWLLVGLRNAAGYGNIRGMAGSIEACAYIALEHGAYAPAVELLGAAATIRHRTGSPLFRFWVKHNDRAHAVARRELGASDYAAHLASGRRLRDEESVIRTAALLRSFAAGDAQGQSA